MVNNIPICYIPLGFRPLWRVPYASSRFISGSVLNFNVSCILFFYKYCFGKCLSELSELIPPRQVFTRNTRLSRRSHAYTVATMSHRTTHYREKSFFTRTARLWNDLPPNIFSNNCNISSFEAKLNKHFLLSSHSI